jgi:uncharacterized protein (AIM24 family)
MPFCTNCGNRLQDDSRTCTGCGRALGNGSGKVAAAPAPAPEPLDYTIQGDNQQMVRINLKPGQELYAAAGKLVYKFEGVQWESRVNGQPLANKMLFLTHFRATRPSEVGFGGGSPGRIQAFDLNAGQGMLVERGGFVCAQSTTQLNVALVERSGSGGEEFVLEKLTGPGTVFIHAEGDFVELNLNPGQTIEIDTGCLVAFDESVGYDIELAGGNKRDFRGCEGLFLTTLTGPGRVIAQSLPRQSSPSHGSDEHQSAPALAAVLGSDN